MQETASKIMGLDIGTVRIGVSISDSEKRLAFPLCTIHLRETPNPVARILELMAEHHACALVAGLPLKLDGGEGPAVRRTRRFLSMIHSAAPDIPIEEFDERLTSMEAERVMASMETSAKKKKELVDNIAAAIILQTYLDSK